MELFDFPADPSTNLLPADGVVNYYGKIVMPSEALEMTKALLENIEWRNDEAVIYGKRIITKRKVAWYGEEAFSYTYSNTTKTALPWRVLRATSTGIPRSASKSRATPTT